MRNVFYLYQVSIELFSEVLERSSEERSAPGKLDKFPIMQLGRDPYTMLHPSLNPTLNPAGWCGPHAGAPASLEEGLRERHAVHRRVILSPTSQRRKSAAEARPPEVLALWKRKSGPGGLPSGVRGG
jgi:hypothetical protein